MIFSGSGITSCDTSLRPKRSVGENYSKVHVFFSFSYFSLLTCTPITGAASQPTEEIAWDEDSEDEDASATTPKRASQSTATLTMPDEKDDDTATLKAAEPRKSHDQQSTAGSDASYDIVSGATSRAPGSPATTAEMRTVEESDEEDWE